MGWDEVIDEKLKMKLPRKSRAGMNNNWAFFVRAKVPL